MNIVAHATKKSDHSIWFPDKAPTFKEGFGVVVCISGGMPASSRPEIQTFQDEKEVIASLYSTKKDQPEKAGLEEAATYSPTG